MQNTESNSVNHRRSMLNITVLLLDDRSTISMIMNNRNGTQTACCTTQMLLKSRAQSDSRTYLIRDENRDGQMSKQKTASVSAGLRDRKGQTERGRSPQEQMRQERENTERFVRQRSSMRLDSPADRQHSDWAGRAARYMAL